VFLITIRNFAFLIIPKRQQHEAPNCLLSGSSDISITVGKFIKNQHGDRHILFIFVNGDNEEQYLYMQRYLIIIKPVSVGLPQSAPRTKLCSTVYTLVIMTTHGQNSS
jgi:hypothetical protein